jgi:uncharacterized protein (DUF2126 family)
MASIALLWNSVAAMLLDPQRRPGALRDWGSALHDRMLLPSQLRQDLQSVLADLDEAGLLLEAEPFEAIWDWRFPLLLDWHDPASGAKLQVRQALEPWPLICDTPREGGFTSRFVDASLRRIELLTNPAFRQSWDLRLQGRPLPLGEEPVAVRWRAQRLYPCLHPGIAPHDPLRLQLWRAGEPEGEWHLAADDLHFEAVPLVLDPETPGGLAPYQLLHCSLDLRWQA